MPNIVEISIRAQNQPDRLALLALLDIVSDENRYKSFVNQCMSAHPEYVQRRALLEAGFFSGMEFLSLLQSSTNTSSLSTEYASRALRKLNEWMFIGDMTNLVPGNAVSFQWNHKLVARFKALSLIDNIVNGTSYLIEKYEKSVLPVIVSDSLGDLYTGTGFVSKISPQSSKFFMVSAKHNVGDDKKFIEFGSTDVKPVGQWFLHPSLDLACIEVTTDENVVPIYLSEIVEILTQTISLGYPGVGRVSKQYLLAHRGEVNAKVKDYSQQDFLLISHAVSPGNSGGPVIDEAGLCIGMVVQAFEAKHLGGITLANAAIPALDIVRFLAAIEASAAN